MQSEPIMAQAGSLRLRGLRFALGLVITLGSLLLLGEFYLRWFPPPDLHPFLGNDSPLTGNLAPHPDFGVGFASWDMLRKDNPHTLKPGSPLLPTARSVAEGPAEKPVWLFLGSSFAFELVSRFPKVFTEEKATTLDRREKMNVRMAQIQTLLDAGSRPDHIFLVLIRPDFIHLGEFQLEHQTANDQGGYVIEPRLPPGVFGALTAQSRLAFTGWSRLGLHKDQPNFRHRDLSRRVPASMQSDLDKMFAGLGQSSKRHGVPVTVIPIPERRIVLRKEGFALEDALVALTRAHDLDCFDPRPLFLRHARPEQLYVADGHLSHQGNLAVLRELKKHLNGPLAGAVGAQTLACAAGSWRAEMMP